MGRAACIMGLSDECQNMQAKPYMHQDAITHAYSVTSPLSRCYKMNVRTAGGSRLQPAPFRSPKRTGSLYGLCSAIKPVDFPPPRLVVIASFPLNITPQTFLLPPTSLPVVDRITRAMAL